MVTHEPLHDSLGRGVQARLLTTRMGLWGDVASGTVLAQHVLDEGKTHAEHVGNGALRTESPLAGVEDLLTSINRVCSHTAQASLGFSYDQVKTALGKGAEWRYR
jgi:hypothetical protein